MGKAATTGFLIFGTWNIRTKPGILVSPPHNNVVTGARVPPIVGRREPGRPTGVMGMPRSDEKRQASGTSSVRTAQHVETESGTTWEIHRGGRSPLPTPTPIGRGPSVEVGRARGTDEAPETGWREGALVLGTLLKKGRIGD